MVALACATAAGALRAAQAQDHVFATVVDDKGRPVPGLNVSDFVVEIDGVAQEIIRAEPAATPLSIVLLTDRLGLNSNYTPFDLRQALGDFVKLIRARSPESRFALTTFDGPIVQLTRFTSAPAELDRALGRLSSIVPTAVIVDAVSDGARQLAAAPTGRRALFVVLSSYREDQSNLQTDLVGEQLRMSSGSLWAVEVQSDRTNLRSAAREELLDAGSRLSGGVRDVVSSRSGLINSCRRLAELLLAQYEITYGPTRGSGRSRLAVGVKAPGLRVYAPSWLSR